MEILIIPVVVFILFVVGLYYFYQWSAKRFLLDHFDDINSQLSIYGFSIEYQVSETYGEEFLHLFRVVDNRNNVNSPWASPVVMFSWVKRMRTEPIESVFADAVKHDMEQMSRKKALPFSLLSLRKKK